MSYLIRHQTVNLKRAFELRYFTTLLKSCGAQAQLTSHFFSGDSVARKLGPKGGNEMPYNYYDQNEFSKGAITIYEYQRGLLYQQGQFIKVLLAGRYRLWPWNMSKIVIIDVRRTTTHISNQKLLTSDQITVTLNLIADYEINDVKLATHAVANYSSKLHEDVQMAARQVIAGITVDELVQSRASINTQIQEMVAPLVQEYGITLHGAAVIDVILAPKVRDLLMKEVESRRVAQAMLIGAREEVAAMRALANAAKLAQDNPALLRLRELDVARSFSQNAGNTLVMGLDKANVNLSTSAKTKSSPKAVADDEEPEM